MELISSDGENDNQFYQKNLNIFEPCRLEISSAQIQKTVHPESCCEDYGIVSFSIICDKNFVCSGDKINLEVVVNNTRGTGEINGFTIRLKNIRKGF